MTTCPHAAIATDDTGLPEFDPHAPQEEIASGGIRILSQT